MRSLRYAAVLWLGGLTGAVLAQDAVPPTALPLIKEEAPLGAWGLAAAFLIGALAIAFKTSKRGHLD